MTRLRDITLESGSLTGSDGFSLTAGTTTLDSSSVLKDTYSARWNNVVSSYGRYTLTAENEIFISVYVKFNSIPTASARVIQLSDGTTTQANIQILTTGKLRLRNNSTTVGSDSTLTLSAGSVYRIGIRQKKESGAGAGDGILEAYVAANDDAFGTAFASSSAQSITNGCSQVNVGATASSPNVDMWADDIKIDNASMPGPSVSTAALSASGTIAITGSAGLSVSGSSSVALSASGTIAITGSAGLTASGGGSAALSASGSISITGSAALTVTGGSAGFGASGTIRITGSASLAVLTPGGWHWTRFKRPLIDRYLNVTIAATGGLGYLGVSKDGSAWSWFSGPLAADGRTLTAVADETAAKAAAISLPASGVWALPTTTEARIFKLGHKNAGVGYTVNEFYPRRLVEADDIRAESIRAIHIAAGSITGDRIYATAIDGFVITGSTIQTAASGARVVLSSAAYGGLIGYSASDTYNPAAGTGTYQVRWDKNNGALYAGAGAVKIDANGITLTPGSDYSGNIGGLKYTDGGFERIGIGGYKLVSAITEYAAYMTSTHRMTLSCRTAYTDPLISDCVLFLTAGYTQSGGSPYAQLYPGDFRVGSTSFVANSGSVQCTGWFRSYGATGWFNQTYQGGWFMQDSSWIRSYNGKQVLIDTATGTQLQLQGSSSTAVRLTLASTINSSNNLTIYHDGTSTSFYSAQAAVNVMTLYSGAGVARVGIRKDAPGWALEVGIASQAAQPGGGSWVNSSSDIRTKTVLGDYEYGLDAIRRLRVIRYEYNGDGDTPAGTRCIGFVAQEAGAVIPDMIAGTRRGTVHNQAGELVEVDDLLSLTNDPANYAVFNAIQELADQIDQLRAEIASLKRKKAR